MTDRKFYATTFTFKVLSEEPVYNSSLADLTYAVDEGPCVMHSFDSDGGKTVTPKDMADLLTEAGSDPSFFDLDPDGTDNEDYQEQP
jgi:hypothetical protein